MMKKEAEMSAEKVVKQPKPKLMSIKLEKLHPFRNHPYKVIDDESMAELTESIKQYGLLSRIIVCPLEDKPEEYEIISGSPPSTRRRAPWNEGSPGGCAFYRP